MDVPRTMPCVRLVRFHLAMTKDARKNRPIDPILFHTHLVKLVPAMHQRTCHSLYKLETYQKENSLGNHQSSSDNHIPSTELLAAIFDISSATQYKTMQRISDRRHFCKFGQALSIDIRQMNIPSNINKDKMNESIPYFSNKSID